MRNKKKRGRGVRSLLKRNGVDLFEIFDYPVSIRAIVPNVLTTKVIETLKHCKVNEHFFVPNNKNAPVGINLRNAVKNYLEKNKVGVSFRAIYEKDVDKKLLGIRFKRVD